MYRIISEFVVNIFKHSKGYYSLISLYNENNVIVLNIKNYGDFVDDEELNNKYSVGLQLTEYEIYKLNGEFSIENKIDKLGNEKVVNICVKIPIERRLTYESFINRRS